MNSGAVRIALSSDARGQSARKEIGADRLANHLSKMKPPIGEKGLQNAFWAQAVRVDIR